MLWRRVRQNPNRRRINLEYGVGAPTLLLAGKRLVAAAGNCELTRDGGKDGLNFITEPDQNRDRHNGNKSQDQGVLDEGLAPLIFSLAALDLFKFHEASLALSEKAVC